MFSGSGPVAAWRRPGFACRAVALVAIAGLLHASTRCTRGRCCRPPQATPGRFVQGNGKQGHYRAHTSELVRFMRNLSEHFADQRPAVRAQLMSGVGAAASGSALGGVEEQERAVGQFFFRLFSGLVLRLWAAERGAGGHLGAK